jgi:DNA-binding CsgD family transcriptional regulator/PAS domain-containing protein
LLAVPIALEAFSKLVEQIYAAALDPLAWSPAMGQLASLQGSTTAILVTPATPPAEGGFAITHGVGEQEAQEWARYAPLDPWTEAGMRRGLMRNGNVVLGHDLVPDGNLQRSTFYKEFLSRYGHRHLCTGVVFGLDETSAQVPVVCSLHRSEGDEPFGPGQVQVHRLVVNHLSRAIGTSHRLRDAELRLAASLQALDRLHGAVLLLGHRGEVLFVNQAAQRLLHRADGLALQRGNPLTDQLGRLKGTSAGDTHAIEQEIARTLRFDPAKVEHFSHGLTLQKSSGTGHLVLRMAPLSPHSDVTAALMDAGAVVFVSDTGAHLSLDATLLQRLFGITPAECRLAEALLEGSGLAAVAARLGISENTAHSHLKRLFEKTDTHRQAELVRLLMGLVHAV